MRVPFVNLKAQYTAIQSEVDDAVREVLDSAEFVLGPNVRALESEFAAFCGCDYAVGVGSGTDALYLALLACGVGHGDEVITVAHSFFATTEAILQTGAVPVYVDIDPRTYTLDASKLDAAITPRTRGIVPVHLYGQMADMEPIVAVAQRHGLVVVEDACQAHGAVDRGLRAGNVGDAAAFSFHASQNLGACGEAGMVTTNSREVAAAVRRLRNHGSEVENEHLEVGTNSRLDELQAAILRVKLRHLDHWNRQRQAIAQEYGRLLAHSRVELPLVRDGAGHVYHLYVVRVPERDRVREVLADRGIETGIHYPIPINRQRAMREYGWIAGELRVTEDVVGQILSLPIYPEITSEQLDYVATALDATVGSDLRMRAG